MDALTKTGKNGCEGHSSWLNKVHQDLVEWFSPAHQLIHWKKWQGIVMGDAPMEQTSTKKCPKFPNSIQTVTIANWVAFHSTVVYCAGITPTLVVAIVRRVQCWLKFGCAYYWGKQAVRALHFSLWWPLLAFHIYFPLIHLDGVVGFILLAKLSCFEPFGSCPWIF